MSEEFLPFDEIKKFLRGRLDSNTMENKVEEEPEDQEQPIVGYRILNKLGSGGVSTVFRAHHLQTDQIVALKLLYPHADKVTLKRFVNEGMIMMRLDHPNILKGLDFGVSNGFYFLALEFITGESLSEFLEEGFQFTEYSTFQTAYQVSKALNYLSSMNIVHRDIKPANILLTEEDVKLCDFGFAIDTTNMEDSEEYLDTTCGTVEYLSPEQAKGQKKLDSKSDVYSLGMTCVHMLTCQLPFAEFTPEEILYAHIHEPIRMKIRNSSRTGRRFLRNMLAKKLENRLDASKLEILLEKFMQKLERKRKALESDKK